MCVFHFKRLFELKRTYVCQVLSFGDIKTYIRFNIKETLWYKTYVRLVYGESLRYKNICQF